MSKQTVGYSDPADGRMTASQSVQMVRGYFLMMITLLGLMLMGFIAMFYVSTLWGWLFGLIVGAAELAGIGGGLGLFYYFAIMMPVSRGLNLSAQFWETPSQVHGDWIINATAPAEIQMDDDDRIMPVRIPFGTIGKKTENSRNSTEEQEGLDVIQELRTVSPKCKDAECKCERHTTPFTAEFGEIHHKYPFLQFKTYPYVLTPSGASFERAIIISPCKVDALRRIDDLIFFKGFPAFASTTFVSLSRLFEVDEANPMFGGPMYIISFSSWHVEIAQQLSGFASAFMVPNQEGVVKILNIHGMRVAEQINQQLTTTRERNLALEEQLKDFQGQVFKTAWNIFAQYLRTRQMPKMPGRGISRTQSLILIAIAAIAISLTVAYLLHWFG